MMTTQSNRRAGLAACIAVLGLASVALASAPAGGAAGAWEGAIHLPGVELDVRIELESGGAGWRGTIDIPAQGASGLRLSGIAVEGERVRFAIDGVPGAPTFDGALAADGGTIAGTFRQSGQTFPFDLARAAPAPASAAGTVSPADPFDGFDAWVEARLEEWQVPGVAIAVVREAEPDRVAGYGLRDVAAGAAVDGDTLFMIGSTTKAFTATLAAMLIDEGRLAWDDPIRAHLPEFRLQDETATAHATVRDLLCHRTGLPRHDLAWYGSPRSRQELFDGLRHLAPSREFRERFQYQNLMFMTVGLLEERIAGESWETLVRRRILDPLGMKRSTVTLEAFERDDNRSTGYRGPDETPGETGPQPLPYREIGAVAPAGAIGSSARELTRWLRFWLDRGVVDGEARVDPERLAEMTTPQVAVPRDDVLHRLLTAPEMPHLGYGLGWFVQDYRGHELIHHGGSIDGFGAYVGFLPADGVGVVVLANTAGSTLSTALALQIYDRVLGLTPVDWNARNLALREAVEMAAQAGAPDETQAPGEPARPLADYAGEYAQAGYGTARVAVEDDRLVLRLNGIEGPLEPQRIDAFRLGASLVGPIPVVFRSDARGRIDGLAATLDAAVAPIEFRRLPPEAMRDPAYLDRLVGRYRIGPQGIEVRRRAGGALEVQAEGQPAYALRPLREDTFALEGLTGFTVRFILDGGRVVEAEFHQPNGVFRAEPEQEPTPSAPVQ